jgi:hypothetical protein
LPGGYGTGHWPMLNPGCFGPGWLRLRLPGSSRTQPHVGGLEAAHAVGPEQLQRAGDLAGKDVDRPPDPALPAGHQPVEVGP